jgi:hypothetical protein
MSELAADEIAVTVPCGVLMLAHQPLYLWLTRPVTPEELDWAYKKMICTILPSMTPSSVTGSWSNKPVTRVS